MDNSTWTPIYSGATNKLIAGVSGSNVYIFMENSYSQNGGSWAQIGCIENNNVFSVSGSSKQLIGEITTGNGRYLCIINRSESINVSKKFCENGIKEFKQQGLSTDYYENRLTALDKMMPRLSVASVPETRDNTFSYVYINEAGENGVILYARAGYPDQNASPTALAAAFLVVQFHCTFADVDRPLKQLWDF